MFGYDVGFIGSAIALTSFKTRFGLDTGASTALSSNIVSTFLAGAFFGALFVYPVVDRLGPKVAMLASGLLFLFGSILTVVTPGLLGMIYAGRMFTGLGVGIVSLVVPVYIAECSPPALRGRLVSIFECTLQICQIIGFWIGAMIFQPQSPRFLIRTGQLEKATDVLAHLRHLPKDHEYIQAEIARVQEQLEAELALTNGDRSLKAKIQLLRTPSNIKRLVIGTALMTLLATTATIIKGLGFTGTNVSLLGTGIYGLVKATFCIAFLLFGVDRFGRRNALIVGSVGASFCLFWLAGYTGVTGSLSGHGAAGAGAYVSLVFIFIFAVFLSISWTGIPWLYCAEIFPPVVRPVATVYTTMVQWLVQFVIVYATPYMIKSMDYGVFIFFGLFTVFSAFYVYYWIPETRNIPLEKMDLLFSQTGNAAHHRQNVLDVLAAEAAGETGTSEKSSVRGA
ncbi:Quinate permease [Pseudohyphozyma bogoriensis]|nr:Quinate permease [Pseudohyphozyma bogoriensis]